MFYTVYLVTNLTNQKTYIGKHQTTDLADGYFGSGRLIQRAIKKYGIENFKKEILFIFNSEAEMNAKEAELVNEEYLASATYNLCPGGQGGFGYINKNSLQPSVDFLNIKRKEKLASNAEFRAFWSELGKRNTANLPGNVKFAKGNKIWLGRMHTEEAKKKMSAAAKGKHEGKRNSQYGTCWMTDGVTTIKINKNQCADFEAIGYIKGRTLKDR